MARARQWRRFAAATILGWAAGGGLGLTQELAPVPGSSIPALIPPRTPPRDRTVKAAAVTTAEPPKADDGPELPGCAACRPSVKTPRKATRYQHPTNDPAVQRASYTT